MRVHSRSRHALRARGMTVRYGMTVWCGMTVILSAAAQAQIPQAEFVARREALASRIDSGIVVAFGARTPVTDFGPFYQLPAFHYLTNYDEADAALVMVVRGKRAISTLFLTPVAPRTSFYY